LLTFFYQEKKVSGVWGKATIIYVKQNLSSTMAIITARFSIFQLSGARVALSLQTRQAIPIFAIFLKCIVFIK
jgi:hypothetical protein